MTLIDLHCDLLGCVQHNPKLTFYSPEVRCSIPQLEQGNVTLQTMAIAAVTKPGSTQIAKEQCQLYRDLLHLTKPFANYSSQSGDLHTLVSIENASCLAEEEGPLEPAFDLLDVICKMEKVFYISLTWNEENRFGGGNATSIGLKPDGAALLEVMAEKGIAIDLSHTSDALAYDILNHIDKKGLSLKPIASHSNFRAVLDHPRNLPDELAREIIKRGGLIGINFIRRFVGETLDAICEHIQHGIALGGEKALALGSDFYGGIEDVTASIPGILNPPFQEALKDSSCYSSLLNQLPSPIKEGIAWQNADRFLREPAATWDRRIEHGHD